MATVRITNHIREHVRNRFHALFQKRLEAKMEELQHLDIGNQCFRQYIPEKERQLIEQLNSHQRWVEETATINIEMKYFDLDGKECIVTFTVKFIPPVPLPARFRGYNARMHLKPEMPAYPHAVKIFHEHAALTRERDSLIKTIVNDVLTNCGSLRQVLEHWPSAMEFMPEDVVEQHNRPTEKRVNTAKDVTIDESVKATLLKARMLSGGT